MGQNRLVHGDLKKEKRFQIKTMKTFFGGNGAAIIRRMSLAFRTNDECISKPMFTMNLLTPVFTVDRRNQ